MKWQVLIPILSLFVGFSTPAQLKKPLQKPKLVVILVIDQLRADYLTRFEKRLKPAKSATGLGGFNYLTSKGAYFPWGEYEVLHSMTCPGHAMISTGAHPVMNGIIMNEWYDKNLKKKIYCVEDNEYGFSPRYLKTTTIGDELKNAGYKSKVVGISLKDRSAIMLTGHRADDVYWFNEKTFAWETSAYYRADKSLPNWVSSQNEKIKRRVGQDYIWESKEKPTGLSDDSDKVFKKTAKIGSSDSLTFPYGVDLTVDLAKAAVKDLKLGKSDGPDVLAVSFSSFDHLGHLFGPNSREMEELFAYHDRALAQFFDYLQSEGLLKDSVIVLTADHGVAPSVNYSKKSKIEAAGFNYLSLFKNVNAHLDKKYGKPSNGQWIAAQLSMNYYLDRTTLAEKKIPQEELEREIKKILVNEPGVWFVMTSHELAGNSILPQVLKEQALRQYDLNKSGDVVIVPFPFFMPEVKGTTHVTGFSYDRTVPIIFTGKNIRSGIYPDAAKIIDIAPTLSFLLGVLPPATSSGKVLNIF